MFENLAFETTCRSTLTVSNAASLDPTTCLRARDQSERTLYRSSEQDTHLLRSFETSTSTER